MLQVLSPLAYSLSIRQYVNTLTRQYVGYSQWSAADPLRWTGNPEAGKIGELLFRGLSRAAELIGLQR